MPKVLRNGAYEVRSDTAFEQVMRGCAAPRSKTRASRHLDRRRHDRGVLRIASLGYAHSVETWMDGKLVGGLYGVSIGRMFYGESMFSDVQQRFEDRAGPSRQTT